MKRCICVYRRQDAKTWVLRVIHPRCPRHGDGGTNWKAVPDINTLPGLEEET